MKNIIISYDMANIEDLSLYPINFTIEIIVYKWKELFGTNYSKSNYMIIKNEIPYLILSIDSSTFEQYVDNSGNIETIISYAT